MWCIRRILRVVILTPSFAEAEESVTWQDRFPSPSVYPSPKDVSFLEGTGED